MKVIIQNRQKDLPISRRPLQQIVEVVLSLYKKKTNQVIIHLVSAKRICQLHADFFDDPTLTDCISFPIDPQASLPEAILGEIFVCPYTAIDYSVQHQQDPYDELALYIVHGLLHCIGYDDIDPKDRKKMRAAERKALKKIQSEGLSLKPPTLA